MLGEGFDVAIILSGVELQGFAAELASLPILIEGMIQQVLLGDRPVAEAVAALYAYEGQVPEIASTKIDGLKKFYGIDQPEALAYFTIHEEADKEHRAAWRGWLEEHAEGNEDEIVATAKDALNALWGALDAVHCKKRAPVH